MVRRVVIDVAQTPGRAFLVAVEHGRGALLTAGESLEELARLSEPPAPPVVGRAIQVARKLSPGTLIGSGKIEEVKQQVRDESATVAIFDDELSQACPACGGCLRLVATIADPRVSG